MFEGDSSASVAGVLENPVPGPAAAATPGSWWGTGGPACSPLSVQGGGAVAPLAVPGVGTWLGLASLRLWEYSPLLLQLDPTPDTSVAQEAGTRMFFSILPFIDKTQHSVRLIQKAGIARDLILT